MRPIAYREMLVRNYHSTMCNTLKEQDLTYIMAEAWYHTY